MCQKKKKKDLKIMNESYPVNLLYFEDNQKILRYMYIFSVILPFA